MDEFEPGYMPTALQRFYECYEAKSLEGKKTGISKNRAHP